MANPLLVVTGIVGFALRGGIVLLLVPILVLPTSVEVRLLLGNGLGTSGLTPLFFAVVATLSVLSVLVAVAVLYVLARCELSGFSQFVGERLPQGRRRVLTTKLFVVEGLALLAVLVAAVPLAAAIGQSTYSEITLPSSTNSMYSRIFDDVTAPIIGFVAALVLIEAVSAVMARRTMAGAFGLGRQERMIHHPFRMLLVGATGWALLIGALVISLPALALAWDAVRSVFLATGLSGDVADIGGSLLVALLFGAVFAAALFVCGLVSAIRSGLWTLASLR